MDPRQAVITLAVILAALLALAGLAVRGRMKEGWSFVAYLLAVIGCDSLGVFWQSRFYTGEFWMARQAVFDILKTAVALEMAWRVVRAFPGALRTARLGALVLLAGSTAVLAAGHHTARYAIVYTWQPRVVACTAMLFTLTALLVAWYHLPIRRLHRAIMGSFAVYLAFFVTLLSMLKRTGWESRETLGLIDALVYLGVLVYWARVAWSRVEEPMFTPEALKPEAAPAPRESTVLVGKTA